MSRVRNVPPAVRLVALALVLLGLAVAFIAYFGPYVGLGRNEDFVAYRLLGLPRRRLADLAIWTAGAGAMLFLFARFDFPGLLRRSLRPRVAAFLVLMVVLSATVAVSGFLVYQAATKPLRNPHKISFFAEENLWAVPDPELAWVPKPNFNATLDTGVVVTPVSSNALGARVNAPGAVLPTEIDVITVGSSNSWGQGVRNEETFSTRRGAMLGVEAMNFSAPGYGGLQSVMFLRRLLRLRPKIIIYSFFPDHLNRNLRPCAAMHGPFCLAPPRVRFEGGAPSIKYPPPHAAERTNRRMRSWEREALSDGFKPSLWSDIKYTAISYYEHVLVPAIDDRRIRTLGIFGTFEEDEKLRANELVFSLLKSAAGSIGALPVVVYTPDYLVTGPMTMPPEFAAQAKRHGLVLVSMLERFNAMRREDISIPGDGHLSAASHRAIAEEVAHVLRARIGAGAAK